MMRNANEGVAVLLSNLKRNQKAFVVQVLAECEGDVIAMRLEDIGFICGEPVRIVNFGPFGGDPMVVQIGFTRFALRKSEANRVHISFEEPSLLSYLT